MNVVVKIRSIGEKKAVPFCECPWDRLEALRREVSMWGIYDGDDTTDEVVGQFVVSEGEAFFELIVGEDE